MSYRIEAEESVEDAIRRIAQEQIDDAIDEIDDSDVDVHETVHQVRKRCKKIRGLIRLTRPAFENTYDRENTIFRDAARELSELRDSTSRIECLERLGESLDLEDKRVSLDSVHAFLVDKRDEIYRRDDVSDRLERFRETMVAARARVKEWSLDAESFDAIGGGLKKTYRRARRALEGAQATATVESFHELRKRVKYHRYHVRLLENLWEPVLDARREELHRLSDLLGDAHDLAVLRRFVVDEGGGAGVDGEVQLVVALADARRKELDARALPLARRLLADEPGTFGRGVRAYWESWQVETGLSSLVSSSLYCDAPFRVAFSISCDSRGFDSTPHLPASLPGERCISRRNSRSRVRF